MKTKINKYSKFSKLLFLILLAASFVWAGIIPTHPSSVNAATNTLGNTSSAGTPDTGDRNNVNAFKFTMPNEAGTISSISVYVASPISAAPNNQIQVGVYSDVSGRPRTLIASSSSATATGNSWNTVPITASVVANTTYWLAYNTNASVDTNNNLVLSPGGTCQYSWTTQTFGAWPATINAVTGCGNSTGSIYATYTISGTPPDTTPPTLIPSYGIPPLLPMGPIPLQL